MPTWKRKPADLNKLPVGSEANVTRPVFSSPRAALDALQQIQEWGKWMAGIQTAAIAGLGAILLEAHKAGDCLSCFERTSALLAFLFLSLGLVLSSYVLSSVPSLSLRLGFADTRSPLAGSTDPRSQISISDAPGYDIYEWPSFTWFGANQISLGLLMGLQHWAWAIGLAFLA